MKTIVSQLINKHMLTNYPIIWFIASMFIAILAFAFAMTYWHYLSLKKEHDRIVKAMQGNERNWKTIKVDKGRKR